jgi:hypothetical protein
MDQQRSRRTEFISAIFVDQSSNFFPSLLYLLRRVTMGQDKDNKYTGQNPKNPTDKQQPYGGQQDKDRQQQNPNKDKDKGQQQGGFKNPNQQGGYDPQKNK